jgi:hypothetical protein
MKQLSFPSTPMVVAHDRQRLARLCITAEVTGSRETILLPRIHSFIFIRSYHSLRTVQKTISDSNRFAMTVDKVQGQMLKRSGVYPPSPLSPQP